MSDHEAAIEAIGDEVEGALRAMSRRKRRGHTVIDYKLIAELIGFPEGTEITGIFTDPRLDGLIISIVSDDLPEIEPNIESTPIHFEGAVRLLPASKPEPNEPTMMADPDSDDVMYARIVMFFPEKEPIES